MVAVVLSAIIQQKLSGFLDKLGFNYESDFHHSSELKLKTGVDVEYRLGQIPPIYFSYLPSTNLGQKLWELHRNIWNKNDSEVFVAISDEQTLLCASKSKPDVGNPLACKLRSFSYGINSPGFGREELKPLFKKRIDSGFFWNYVSELIDRKKRQRVDSDLLHNLIHLKKDLSEYLPSEKIYVLIERCLFLKFLEDRGFLGDKALIDILKSQTESLLLDRFRFVNVAFNGDIFDDYAFTSGQITNLVMEKLYNFFTSDYRNQVLMFPYKFDIIPVQLLSSIYELFLRAEQQVSNGVYYTPPTLVDLILRETLERILDRNMEPTCLDFACGSGIFLVKALERIINKNNCRSNFSNKKRLLEKCIYGVERDLVAAKITVFSLYLTLLDGENPTPITDDRGSHKRRFPKLLNRNILCKDTLFDEIVFGSQGNLQKPAGFDVVFGNPPWGINPFSDDNRDKTIKLSTDKLQAVYATQSSQYFLLKARDFMHETSIAGIVSNNSNFLMEQGNEFRKKMLSEYTLISFIELSKCNSLFFNVKKIGDLKMGANEPAAVAIFKVENNQVKNIVKYITPSIDPLSKLLQIPIIRNSDIKEVRQNDLASEDELWRILALGNMEDYSLITKLKAHQSLNKRKALKGFEPSKDSTKILAISEYADTNTVSPFVFLEKNLTKVSSGSIKIRARSGGLYLESNESAGPKILIRRYVDKTLKVRAAYDPKGYRFKVSLIGFTSNLDYHLTLSLFNSSLVSYFLVFNTSQVGKGTWNMLHLNEIIKVPIPEKRDIPSKYRNSLQKLTEQIIGMGEYTSDLQNQVDEIIFDIYHLKEFEKQRIRDFFHVEQRERARKGTTTQSDLERYTEKFKEIFSFLLEQDKYLNAEAFISSTIGAAVAFELTNKDRKTDTLTIRPDAVDINSFVKLYTRKQLVSDFVKQEKVKIYAGQRIIIIKSNQLKDWTKTEATKDANEEISLFVKHLHRENPPGPYGT